MCTAEIFIGTSGYSYQDWVGHYYPPGLKQKDMLEFYAREFSFTEINSSYYGLPRPQTFAQMARKVPPGFVFTVKAYRTLTHDRGDTSIEDGVKFREALKPLAEEGKLGAVLLQFPYSFHNTQANREWLVRLKEILGDVPLATEFRHRSWVTDAVFSLLASLKMGFVCVDAPRLKGLPGKVIRRTSSIAYVRFHGRNASKWWEHEQAYQRYDYLYSKEELKEWAPGIASLAGEATRVFIAFNNHYRGQGVVNARMMGNLLRGLGLNIKPPSAASSG